MTNPTIDSFWSLDTEAAIQLIRSAPNGLSAEDAGRRLKENGPNSIKTGSRHSTIVLFFSQFKSPITILLIVAAILSMTLGDVTDAVIILVIILLSSILGFWQERGAANAVDELLKLVQIKCVIIRGGTPVDLPVEQVVPGDVVMLNAGDIIPADGLVMESKDLFIDEAAFTGETFPVEKIPGKAAVDAPLAKRANSVFMGSHVISGKGKILVIKTGHDTEFGKISTRLVKRTPEIEFERGIRRFGYMLMEITLVLIIVIFAINVLLHKPALDSILFSLALAVGLTPQLLPAIISINLSAGAREMAKKKVIVKRLSAIENFGSMNILCSDKTGTLTEGKVVMKDALDIEEKPSSRLLRFGWINASMQQGFNNPIDEAIRQAYDGKAERLQLLSEVPYDFIRKRLSIQVRNDKENWIITKGAFQNIIDVCDRVEAPDGTVKPIADEKARLNDTFENLSREGYRVLGISYLPGEAYNEFGRDDEHNMIFLGFLTFFDPPKKDVHETIKGLRAAGVRLKLITGDNAFVAKSIAGKVGFENPMVLTGPQLRQMSEGAYLNQVQQADIFAEIEPNQKEKIILMLKRAGNVVGFMGDGINDAPALHGADVGISVDTAVDVAKEAADIVLLQQSLDVLVTGMIAGRKTFTNTMKYIFMATSANFGNMFSMAGASLFLPFLPLLPKQILLTNLLTDIPEMTIATDRVDSDAVTRPHRWDIRFIRRFMIVFGLISSIFDYLTFGVLLYFMKFSESVFQTGWFTESVISATLIVLVIRTRLPFFKSLPGRYLAIATFVVVGLVLLLPYLPFAHLLGFAPLPLAFYGWMTGIIVLYIFTAEIAKHLFFKREGLR